MINTSYKSHSIHDSLKLSTPGHSGIYLGHWKLGLSTGKLNSCHCARKILGYSSAAQYSLQGILSLLSAVDKRNLLKRYKIALLTGSNLNMELKVLLPNGTTKWVQLSGTLSYRRWGVPDQFIGTIEDTTQRRFEDNLHLSLIRHEILNPLSVIKLNTERVSKMIEPKWNQEPLRLLSLIDKYVNGITSVLEEHLAFRSSDNQNNLQWCEFDLHQVLDKLVAEMQLLYRQNKFDRLYSGQMRVNADKSRIIKVLINYLTNAVKFSHPCSPIKISTVVKDNLTEICIADSGIGVPKGWEERIFEKDMVGIDRKSRHQNSRGLGLHQVKNIINDHGGKVRAEQVKSGGTAFYFSLPLRQEVRN